MDMHLPVSDRLSELTPNCNEGRCRVMGIVNVTPDSFSDGGRYDTLDSAVGHGRALWADGADYVDIGGESTRPGAIRVSAQEELDRVIPVVSALVSDGIAVSIDTTRSVVARAAVEIGAAIINDVSGGAADPEMGRVAAETGVRWILNHSRGQSRDMYAGASYDDVVSDVCAELMMRVDDAVGAGVQLDRIIVDPGLGFSKRGMHNWILLGRLHAILELGLPVLVGSSRKRFLSSVMIGGDARPPEERDAATLATTVLVAQAGGWGVRVHDVRASADAVRVVHRVRSSASESQFRR